MQKQSLLWLCFITSLLLVLLSGIAQAQEMPVFRIGVLDEERGTISDAARLAVQDINTEGGVRGADGTYYRLELVIQSPDEIADAITAFSREDVIAVLGPQTNEQVLDNLPLLQSLGVPVLTPATSDTLLSEDEEEVLIRSRAAQVHQGRALANYMITQLGIEEVATLQLDLELSTLAGVVGFSTASEALDLQPVLALIRDANTTNDTLVQAAVIAELDALVAYGSPGEAADFYKQLRAAGWPGIFAYPGGQDILFRTAIPDDQLSGVLSTATWAFTANDQVSEGFRNAFIQLYGEIPGEIAAATYDSVLMLQEAIGQPGELWDNLQSLQNVRGIQGILSPGDLADGETSTSVSVIQFNRYGSPVVVARYVNDEMLPMEENGVVIVPVAPVVSPTPEGVYITITGQRQNVRSGPSIDYPVIGQLNQGTQVPVIGATPNNDWVVIDFRGQQGWLATYLLEVTGDLNTVPIIQPPPLPTPVVTPSPTPPQEPDVIIESALIAPQPIVPGQPFTVSLSVRNAGLTPAPAFTISGTFPPNNQNLTAVVPNLAPGQSVPLTLQGIISNTGIYSTSLLVDSLNQVAEGPLGEANNVYNLTYNVDRPILNQGTQTLNLGNTIDLEGNAIQGDANWNAEGALELDAIFGARIGIVPGTDVAQVHWDLISPAIVNRESIGRGELNPGTLIGIITADGNRGVMRVDSVTDQQLVVTFRVYRP